MRRIELEIGNHSTLLEKAVEQVAAIDAERRELRRAMGVRLLQVIE
jgi:hypothetical protein